MPERTYRALLIGNAVFPDDPHSLPSLLGPRSDVLLLGRALIDARIGLHERSNVTKLLDADKQKILDGMAAFFAGAGGEDQLFLYYSGHGRLDLEGQLFLCGRNTKDGLQLRATAVAAADIAAMMRTSPAKAKVIVLDCCYSGAFKGGFPSTNLLLGKGQFGLASSHQLTADADRPGRASPFTACIIEALLLGTLDSDGDGFVTIEDVYFYVHDRLSRSVSSIPVRLAGPTVGTVALARASPPLPPQREAATGITPMASVILPQEAPPLVPVPPTQPRFDIARHLVTNRQFAAFLRDPRNADWRPGGANAERHASRDYLKHWQASAFPAHLSDHPVVNVSPLAAQAFVDWAGRGMDGGLRLLYRHEWEVAVRAGRPEAEWLREEVRAGRVNYRSTENRPTAVGEFGMNPYHLSDLLGNVQDMCIVDGAAGRVRPGVTVVTCGGAYDVPESLLADCGKLDLEDCRWDVGFRCARDRSG